VTSQRKEMRKKLMAFTPVYDLRRKALLGYVSDLTLKGAMIVGEKSVEVDGHFILGIEFPESPSTLTAARAVVSARVAWCREEETGQYFDIGFEFDEISPEAAEMIDSVLTRYQFRPALDKSDLEN
jgi:hypothetical protein